MGTFSGMYVPRARVASSEECNELPGAALERGAAASGKEGEEQQGAARSSKEQQEAARSSKEQQEEARSSKQNEEQQAAAPASSRKG